MDGRTYSPTRITVSAILVVAAAMLLVAAALAGLTRSAAAKRPRRGREGWAALSESTSRRPTFSTPDPSLEYESTGWQVEYATALKLLNWKETKATLFPEAATSFPLVSAGGRRYTFHIRPGLRLSSGRRSRAANFRYAFQRANNPKMNSPAAAFLSDLGSVTTKGKYTLVISLKKARPDFALDRLDAVLPGDLAEAADRPERREAAGVGWAVLHLLPRHRSLDRAEPEPSTTRGTGRITPT